MRSGLTIATCLLTVFTVWRHTVSAQHIHNGSNLYVNGVSIFIDGDVNNNGLVANAGSISFTGDWKNKGKYDGAGLVEAIGRAPQLISQGDQSIHTLVIEGGSTKYVEGPLKVSSELRLAHGIVEVSPRDMLLLENRASTSGGSVESYVDGALTVEGPGYKFFPIGKNGIYAPIELLDVQEGAGRYSMEVFENAPTVSVENVIVRKALYWQRMDVVGHFSGSRVAIDYERNFFDHPDDIILLAGETFDEPLGLINELEHSAETDKISTLIRISAPILMLGELSTEWTDADFYLSTALSPHATYTENKAIKIFGDRLSNQQFRFQVFDRWGDMVFETTSLELMQSTGWDGRASAGRALATGAYPFRLSAVDKMGKKFERKGIVTIVY